MEYSEMLEYKPYELDKEAKHRLLTSRLVELIGLHMDRCELYKNMMTVTGLTKERLEQVSSYEELPFLPVRLFKELELLSVPREDVFKTMTSSGTHFSCGRKRLRSKHLV